MKKWWIAVVVVVLVVIVPIVWYLASPLFLDKIVSEEFVPTENHVVIASGTFRDADDFHKVSGTATIVKGGDQQLLRLEDFNSINGPDLKVYFSSDLEASEYISLGELKGNIGNQNYEISDIDLNKYPYVLIWCEQFSVLFGSAKME